MHEVLILKTVHVLAAVLFLGTGLGSVYYKMRADRSGQIEVIVWVQKSIVLADWLFTVPAGIVLPVTGLWMVHLYNMSLTAPWILLGMIGYAIAGITWLPAAFLQLRMREMAQRALDEGTPLPPMFARYNRYWMMLGVPSFLAALATVWVMVYKNVHF